MKTWFRLLALFLSLAGGRASAQGYPPAADPYVNDSSGLLTAQDRQAIRAGFQDLEQRQGRRATLATVDSFRAMGTGDAGIEDFAAGLRQAWQPGQDRGALLLLSVKERQLCIQLGPGCSASEQARAKELLQGRLLPLLGQGEDQSCLRLGSEELIHLLGDGAWYEQAWLRWLLGGLLAGQLLAGLIAYGRGREDWSRFALYGSFYLAMYLLVDLLFGLLMGSIFIEERDRRRSLWRAFWRL